MLKRLGYPLTLPVTADQAKARLRIDVSDDEDLDLLIRVAMEATENATGLVLQPSDWEYRASCWPDYVEGMTRPRFVGAIDIPAFPVRDITELAYLDAAGVEQVVDPVYYSFVSTEEGASVYFVDGYSFPTLTSVDRHDAVRVRFRAGFEDPNASGSGDDPALELPPVAAMAVLFLVGHWHANREPVKIGSTVEKLPQTFQYLADQLRIYR